MSASSQQFTILPSDTLNDAGTGNTAFEIKFLGIEGSGKNFDLVELVEQRRRSIFGVFGAANLLAGEGGGGSYNLIEGQNSIHLHYLSRDISVIEEVWNNNIISQLFRLNEWNLSEEEMPTLVAGEIEPISLDETSKALQRTGAVGLLPKNDPLFLNEIYAMMGIDYRFDEDLTPEELEKLTGDATSKSGQGMSEGLSNGTGSSTGGGDTSSGNNENTA